MAVVHVLPAIFKGILMEKSFLKIGEVADILKVSVSTVRRAIKAGEIRAVRVGSQGQLRVAESELESYVLERANGGEKKPSSIKKVKSKEGKKESPNVEIIEGKTNSGIPWKVINADVVDGLKSLEEESVNCIVTSPPYFWQRDYEVDGQIGHEESIDDYVDSLTSVFKEAKRVLSKDGVFFLNLGDTFYSAKGRPHGHDPKSNGRQMARRKLRAVDGPGLGLPRKSLIGIPWRVALSLQNDGWTLRNAVIWQRPGAMPEPTAKDRPWRTYEHVFIFSKSPRYWFNRAGLNGDEDIWRVVARPDNPGAHFAPFPRELVERCLKCGCPDQGVVLDPFVGSGTTILEALQRGLPAIGIDLKREYCEFIESRISAEFDLDSNVQPEQAIQDASANG